jgi:protein-tyrosine-phosphatase
MEEDFLGSKTIMPEGILFICLGNSCRSIMAEALARQFFPGPVKIGSAGIDPLGFVTEETLKVLAEAGVATEGLWSKGLSEIDLSLFPVLVNLTTNSLDAVLPRDFHGRVLNYPVPDPFGRTLEAYRQAREAIRRFITEDLPPFLLNGTQKGA